MWSFDLWCFRGVLDTLAALKTQKTIQSKTERFFFQKSAGSLAGPDPDSPDQTIAKFQIVEKNWTKNIFSSWRKLILKISSRIFVIKILEILLIFNRVSYWFPIENQWILIYFQKNQRQNFQNIFSPWRKNFFCPDFFLTTRAWSQLFNAPNHSF